jgi:hypothetical protein
VEEVIRRGAVLLVLAVLAGSTAKAQESSPPATAMENYLPGTASTYVSLPNGRTVSKILTRLGDSETALAKRIAKLFRAPEAVAATAVENLLVAADGPVTYSGHRLRLPGRRGVVPSFVITLRSRSDEERLMKATLSFLKKVVVPGAEAKLTGERIMDLLAVHVTGKGVDLYLVKTQGFVIVCSEAFLLGLVLRELQSPSKRTLRHREFFREAAKKREAAPDAGLLWCRREGLPGSLGPLGIETLTGTLIEDESGYRDEVTLSLTTKSPLRHLSSSGVVPGGWKDAAPDGIWVGAAMVPAGALATAVALLEKDHVMQAMRLDEVAEGPVEVVWRPGSPPMMAVKVKAGANREVATRPLGDLATIRSDAAVVISEDPDAVAGLLTVEPGATHGTGGGAFVRARVSALLAVLGRARAPGARRTSWSVAADRGTATIDAGLGDVGPVQLAVGALLP